MIVRGGPALVVAVGLVGVPEAVAAPSGDVLLISRRIDVAPELAAVGSTGHRVHYRSTSGGGYPVVVSGVVLTPAGAAPPGGWPVVSCAHGTAGVSDRCAPSRDVTLGGFGYAGYLARRPKRPSSERSVAEGDQVVGVYYLSALFRGQFSGGAAYQVR